MSKNHTENKSANKTKISPKVALALVALLVAGTVIGLSAVKSSKSGTGIAPSPSSTAPKTPNSTAPGNSTSTLSPPVATDPFTEANTPEKLADLSPIGLTTLGEQDYQKCLIDNHYTIASSCVVLKNRLSPKISSKIEYDVIQKDIYAISNIIFRGLYGYPSGVFVDGSNYTKNSKVIVKLPSKGIVSNHQTQDKDSLASYTVYIYPDAQVGTAYCVSVTSLDKKMTFRSDNKRILAYRGSACVPSKA